MSALVDYAFDGEISTLRLDDGRVNALSPAMLAAIDAGLDQAERDGAPVVLLGRPGYLSAGFDLKVMRGAGVAAWGMIKSGFELSARLLAHPRPVIIGCTGHAMAMGAFLLLSGDERIGARGEFSIAANEVAIGLTLPHAAVAICRQRLAPAHFHRAVLLSHRYTPETAVDAGFLDQLVEPDELEAAALAAARATLKLDARAHARTKRRTRRATLAAIRASIWLDAAELAWMGARAATARLARRARA